MKCSLCGYEFEQEEARPACGNCPVSKGCDLICCPNCRFEMPVEPKWIARFMQLLKGGRNETKR